MATTMPYPDMSVQVALQARPNSTDNPQWTDITELVVAADRVSRGRPYQVPTGQSSAPTMRIRDPQELFNPSNTVDSPFAAGSQGRQILPYKQILWQAMYPRGGTGNLFNTNFWHGPIDPTFESYTAGTLPSWVNTNNSSPTIINTSAFQGTQSLRWNVTASSGEQSINVTANLIPGRFYIWSAYVFQGVANTIAVWVGGHGDMATTTATGAWTRISGVFYADQPKQNLVVGTHGATINGTIGVDAIMLEQVNPASPTLNFNGPNGGSGSLNGWTMSAGQGAAFVSLQNAAGYHLRAVGITPDGVNPPKFQSPTFAVTPSTQYWLAGIILNSGISRQITVWWYDSNHTFLSSSSPGLFSGGSDWTKFDPAPFTSPATAAFAQVGTEATSVVTSQWYVDHVYLLPGAPSAFTATGPVIYPVLRDFVERWPRYWDSNGFEGFSELQLVDGFAALNAVRPHTEYVQAVLATNPDLYWRLNEQQGSTTFADSSGNAAQPMIRVDALTGPGFFSAGTGTGIPGDAGGTGLSVPASTSLSNVPMSVAVAGAVGLGKPPLAIGGASPVNITVACYLSHGAMLLGASFGQWAWWIGNKDNSINFELVGVTGTPNKIEVGVAVPGGGQAITPVTDIWADGLPHLFVATATIPSGGTTTITMYVDGTQVGTSTCATAAFTSLVATTVEVGGYVDVLQNTLTPGGGLQSGVYSSLAVWNRVLSGAEITDLANAGKGYPGELPSTRLTRHLSRGGYTTGNNNIPANRFSTGRSILEASSSVDRTPALTDAQNIVNAEMGTLWIAPDGALVFEGRDDRFKRTTPVTTFGEDIANGECPYLPGVLYDFDPLYVYGNVQVTQTQGIIATGGRVTDINAVTANYFGRSYNPPGSVDLLQTLMVQDMADWIFYTHNTPSQRIEAITIDPMSNPALWPFVFNVEVGQRIRVRRRPRGLNGALSNLTYDQQYFVEQVIHGSINLSVRQGPLSWKTSLSLTPAPASAQPWLLDDATYSVLGNTTRLGF